MRSPDAIIIRREWWQDWTLDKPPATDFLVMAWDTAYSEKNSADYSACVVWGEFTAVHPRDPERGKIKGIILLDYWRGRLGFPELKKKVLELYQQWRPDAVVIEAKATGQSLCQELNAAGIHYIEPMLAHRGLDKITRVNSVSDMFGSGQRVGAAEPTMGAAVAGRDGELPPRPPRRWSGLSSLGITKNQARRVQDRDG